MQPPVRQAREDTAPCTSLLITEGVNVKAVQARLGHKSAMIALDRYGHLFPDDLDRLAVRLDRVRERARPAAPTDRTRAEAGDTVVRTAEGAGL